MLPARAGVGLLEGFEDDPLLVGGIPMPVSETSKATTVGATLRIGCSDDQPLVADATFSRAAVRGELEGVRQQVREPLEPLGR